MPKKSDHLLERIGRINDKIVSLTKKISPEKALERESSIVADASALGIPFKLPEERLPRGETLAELDQKIRMKGSGIACARINMTITYVVFPEAADGDDVQETLTELLVNYDDAGRICGVYTRTVDRFENRSSIEFSEEDLPGLEETFGLRGAFLNMEKKEKKSGPRKPKIG